MIHQKAVINDPLGLHALLAQELAALAAGFSSSLYLRHELRTCSLRHPIDLLAMGIPSGAEIEVWADGIDERIALASITTKISRPPD